MHELISIAHLHEIKIVALQIVFFISGFQSYLICQSLVGSILSLALFTWVMNQYHEVHIITATIAGLSFSVIMTVLFKLPKNRTAFYIVYYYIVQPLILIKTIPLFVVQTKYPIGYPLAFLVWLPVNLLVYYHHESMPVFHYVAIFSMIVFLLLFGFFIYKTIWIPIILGSTAQIISTILAYYMFIN